MRWNQIKMKYDEMVQKLNKNNRTNERNDNGTHPSFSSNTKVQSESFEIILCCCCHV